MNPAKIKSGDIFKNYKQLCLVLDEKIKEGNSKRLQLKEFERYFQYEKQGQKFLILNVYDNPLPKKEDKRSNGNRRIYLPYVEKILLPYLSGLNNRTGFFTKNELWYILGMINQFYRNISIKDILEENADLTYWQLEKFYQICNYKLSSILFSSLNSLQSRNLITYEEQYVIMSDTKKKIHIANNKEKKIINEAEENVLKEIGICNKSFAALCFKLNELYRKVNEYLKEHYKWEGFYKQYKITLIDNFYSQMGLDENEIFLNKLQLNKKIIDAVNRHAENLCKTQKEKLDLVYNDVLDKLKQNDDIWGEIEPIDKENVKKEYKIFTYPDCFVEVQKMLTQKLLKIDSDDNQEIIV